MIPAISEINFPSYATLHQATVTLADMGERTIATQVKIDGDVVPSFNGWELRFRGERFVLPSDTPPASKDNTTRCALVDLTFKSWAIEELKRYFFVQMASTDPSNPNANMVADKYEASLRLSVADFATAFNKVLDYYFKGDIVLDLNPYPDVPYSLAPVDVEISHTKIWDVITEAFYDKYGLRWYIAYDGTDGKYHIKVNYPADSIDHIFQYGYDGGLIRFERQVQDEDVVNVLIGRGGEKNLPYRYFKREDQYNPEWKADPDAIPELANIYFDRLHDINFRWYVRGWRTNQNRDTSWPGTYIEPYNPGSVPEAYRFAYVKGHEDDVFTPVEYVKNDASIARYGEHWGARDDDDEIFPTIQGMEPYDGLGRVDEVVDVEQVVSDDIEGAAAVAIRNESVKGSINISYGWFRTAGEKHSFVLHTDEFSVPEGETCNIQYSWMDPMVQVGRGGTSDVVIRTDECSIVAIDESSNEHPPYGLQQGTYRLRLTIVAEAVNNIPHTVEHGRSIYPTYTFGYSSIRLLYSQAAADAWRDTFDIWVKNIWNTTKGSRESETKYAKRVWEPILGDKLGNEAKVVFSDGAMATSSDYEFLIADYPAYDRSKTITTTDKNGNTITVQSEWRITLRKYDTGQDTTARFVPNTQMAQAVSGNHFFFTGIDMPFDYVIWNEEKLNEAKQADMSDTVVPNPVWVIGIDKVRAHTLEADDLGELLADKLATGAKLTITDPRFTNSQQLQLYAQTVTYTWNEGTVMAPDIEVVLSEKSIIGYDPLAVIQDELTAGANSAMAGSVSWLLDYVSSIFARRIGGRQLIDAPTNFGSEVASDDFHQGMVGGKGWSFYKNGDDETVLEVDRIMARNGIETSSIVANQVSYVGGKQIRSAAAIEITSVVETDTGYICYFDQRHGSVANLFKVNDIALGQAFDAESNESRTFRRLVTAVDVNSVTLSKTVVSGTGVPVTGDTIVQFGNTTDPARQFAIVSDVIGGGYEQMLSGLNSVSATGSEYYFAGTKYTTGTQTVLLLDKDGNPLYDVNDTPLGFTEGTVSTSPRWFVGNAQGEYAEWQNGELTVKGSIIVKNSDGTYSSIDAYKSIKETADYLRAALPADTDGVTLVQGGIVLSNIIGVVRGGDLVAGMNASNQIGYNSSHGTLMVFAGAEDADQVSDARFRVYEDGHVVANDLVAVNGDSDVCVTITGDSIGSGSTTPATNYWPAFSTSKQLSNPGPSGMQQTNEVHSTYSLSTLQSSVSGAGTLTIPQRSISVGIAFSSAYASSEIGRVILTAKLYCNGTVLKTVSTNAAYPGGASTLSLTIPQATADITGSYNLRYELSVSFTSSKANTLTVTPSSTSATTVSYSQNTQNVVLGNDGIRVQLSSTAFFMAKMEPSNPTIQMVVGDQTIFLGTGGIYFKLGGTTTYKAGVAYNGTNYYMTLTAV